VEVLDAADGGGQSVRAAFVKRDGTPLDSGPVVAGAYTRSLFSST